MSLNVNPITPPMNTLNIIKLILDRQLNMEPERVFAWNSSIELPKDGKLFIVLAMLENEVIANNIRYKSNETGLQEHQTVNTCQNILVSLCSLDTSAMEYAPYARMAMASTYAQGLMEQYTCHISQTGNIRDASFLEATARLFRYDFEIKVFRSYATINDVDYYDKFPNNATFEPQFYFQP